QVGDGRAVGELLIGSVEDDFHDTPSYGLNAAPSSGQSPSTTRLVISSAVIGVSRTPLRWWPTARMRPSSGLAPRMGLWLAEAGRNPTLTSANSYSAVIGRTVRASRSRSPTPPAVGMVSNPRSSLVAPTTSSPDSRGTR